MRKIVRRLTFKKVTYVVSDLQGKEEELVTYLGVNTSTLKGIVRECLKDYKAKRPDEDIKNKQFTVKSCINEDKVYEMPMDDFIKNAIEVTEKMVMNMEEN